MKKTLACIIAFFALVQNSNANPYFGLGYQLNQLNLNDVSLSGLTLKSEDYIEKDLHNINVFAGYDFGNNFAAEIGFFKKSESKANNNTGLLWISSGDPLTTDIDSTLQIINLDGIYSIPANSRIKFLAIATVAKIDYKTNITLFDGGTFASYSTVKDNGFGYGAGIGLEAQVVENLSARITAKYVRTASIDTFDDLLSYNFGLKYQF